MFQLIFGLSFFEFFSILIIIILLSVISFRLRTIIELFSMIERRIKHTKHND